LPEKLAAKNLIYKLIAHGRGKPEIFYDDFSAENAGPYLFWRARCVHPFFNLSVKPSGSVFPCCGPTEPIGNLASASLSQIAFSSTRRKFLRSICSDDPPPGCEACSWLNKKGLSPKMLNRVSKAAT